MNFQTIEPYPILKKYIEQIFVLESAGKLPQDDLKLIVPNGRVKLVIPFKNSIRALFNGKSHASQENKIILIGLSDLPSVVDMEKDEPAGNITVEFSPLGAYRFLNIKFSEIKNTICSYENIAGKTALFLEERLVNTPTIPAKIKVVQAFLTHLLLEQHDHIFDYCIQKLMNDKGKTSIKDLEKATGYSARWLNTKFNARIGTSAKNLASIIRFQQYYQLLNQNKEQIFFEKLFYQYYYDQSHFIKEFKRFTGYAPLQLTVNNNHYDQFFYKG